VVSEGTRKNRDKNRILHSRARQMRHEPTTAELKFWYAVRDRRLEGLKFRRQVPIGPYIVDFLCAEHRLIVEIDGGQHNENPRDQARDATLSAHGYRILRFWNVDVMENMDGVVEIVLRAAGKL
jgi:adenine-specific DNA-methyltransferase